MKSLLPDVSIYRKCVKRDAPGLAHGDGTSARAYRERPGI
jgi:hypothetical protein